VNTNLDKINKISNFAKNCRVNILEMALSAGSSSSHFGGALSIVEIVSTIFDSYINIDSNKNLSKDRNRFILSKGHACLAYYAALCEKGLISKDKLQTFEKNETDLLGHPVINKDIGVEFSTGSLGMGLSIAIGLGVSYKKRGFKNRIFVVLGDGECNEGSVWEAAMAIPNFNLNNINVIVDNNGFQQTGKNHEIMNTESLKDKWESFGWKTEILDGHNIEKLFNYFENNKNPKIPQALIAKTIKGKGFSFSENNNDWHHTILTKSNFDKALKEIN